MEYIAALSVDGFVSIWSLQDRKCIHSMKLSSNRMPVIWMQLCIDPYNKLIVDVLGRRIIVSTVLGSIEWYSFEGKLIILESSFIK